MLDDPRARETMHRFAAQWLRMTAVEELAFDELPRWHPELARSARAEITRLADDYLWSDASALDLYRADHTTLDAPLAELYGLPSGRVELAGTDRGGLFSTAAFAMVTSRPTGTSIAKRGVYVLEVALCAPPPSPPEGVDTTLPAGMNPELALDAHVTDARCASCHSLFDPIGRGLERYDPIGALRERYGDGSSIAGEGMVPMLDPPEFSGGLELGIRVAESDAAARCLVEQHFRFALGRTPDEADRCAIDALTTELAASGMRFRELAIALVRSDVFRRGAEP
jgi:hypothetical protein